MTILNSNVTINVSDLEKSISFYESIGFILKNRWGNHYAQMSATGIEIGLHPSVNHDKSKGSGNISIGLSVRDFEEAKLQMQKLGISFQERYEAGGQFLHFNDPDNHSLYFIKPKF